ncbi:MAG: Ig-like domain-containing protein [Lachnospiraceae bacterium]|nr:Ig-like domain-containing protein [Lachnospiraceae bacterium]
MGRKRAKAYRFSLSVAAILLATLVLVLTPAGDGLVNDTVTAQAAPKAAKTTLSKSKLSLAVGEKTVLFVKELASGDKVSFKTSDKKVATVSATGLVTGKKKGSAVVTATVSHLNGKSESFKCKVTVSKAGKTSLKFKDINNKDELTEALSSGKGGAFKLAIGVIGIRETIPVFGDVTLDLSGEMVRGSTDCGMFRVTEGASLTILDSSEKKTAFMLNTGKGGIVDCVDGTLRLDGGSLMSDGERVIYSSGDVIMNGGSLSGGSVGSLYVKEGTVQMNGGDIMGSKTGIRQLGGEVIISDLTVESSSFCLFSESGTMVVGGGKYSVTQNNGYPVTVNGGTVQVNGGEFVINSVGIYIGKGQVFVNGGTFAPSQNGESYGVYIRNTEASDLAEITVNGGSIKAGYAGIFLENVGNGSAVINGGTIESTGVVGITAKDCPLTITGGKIICAETVCSINCENEGLKFSIKGGTFNGGNCLIVIGKPNVTIDGGTYKATGYGLVINSNYDGKLKYEKSLFKKVIDQRKGGEKNSDSDPAGYRRIDVKYTKGMKVSDLNTLYSVFCLSCEKLITPLEIYAPAEYYDIIMKYAREWRQKYEGYYETSKFKIGAFGVVGDPYKTITIDWEFGKEHQINSIAADSSVYSAADKDVQAYSDRIDEILDSIITKKMTDEEKVIAVHDYMCENYEYAKPIVESGPKSDHTFHAMLDDGTGVCQAYASLFHVMMLKVGVKDELVVGESTSTPWGASREAHMWNRVLIDNEWLYVDVTWDDGGADDTYLLKTEKEFYSDGKHFPQN